MKRVLIVDDKPENRYLLRVLLEGHGYAVEEACHGAEALVKARSARPQLIISDLLMPVMDGYSLLRHWKADAQLNVIPFVIYTATYTEPRDERLALEMGADAFIVKPAEPEPFLERIENVLSQTLFRSAAPAHAPQGTEGERLEQYNEVLIHKLEDKATQLEDANRALQQDIVRRRRAEAVAADSLREAERAQAALALLVEEQRAAQGALRESEQRLRLALDAAQMGIFDWDMTNDRVTWSREHERLWGFAPGEVGGTYAAFAERVHPADLPGLEAEVARCIAARATFFRESRVLWPDGSEHWMAARGELEFDEAGHALRMRGAVLEVTERKRAELSLLEKEHLLSESQRIAHVGTWRWDPKTGPIQWSDEILRIFRVSPQDFALTRETFFRLIHRDDLATVEAWIRAGLAGESPPGLEFRIVPPDGEPRFISGRCELKPATDSAPASMVGTLQDITERRQSEQNRQRLEEQIRQSQKLDAIGQLAAGIAHDLNNILGAIVGNADLARCDLSAEHPALLSVTEILRAGQRAKELVQRILAFSRPHAEEFKLIQLQPVVEEAVRLLRATLPAGVELRCRTAPALSAVRADASQVHQILVNLVTNAWHAIGRRGGSIDLRLEACEVDDTLAQAHAMRRGPHVRLTVSDNGEGMDRATLSRIFEPFFTTKPAGQGAGLGLSVVHRIVRDHDGTTVVESQPGKGTTFRVYLPASADHATPPRDESHPREVRGRGEHILFVDDEEPLVLFAGRFLNRLGYRFEGHSRVEAAMAAFLASPHSYDLIITDYNMPGMSGIELAKECLRVRPDVPIALTSGYMRPDEVAQCYAFGIREVLLKPYTMNALAPVLQRLVAGDDVGASGRGRAGS